MPVPLHSAHKHFNLTIYPFNLFPCTSSDNATCMAQLKFPEGCRHFSRLLPFVHSFCRSSQKITDILCISINISISISVTRFESIARLFASTDVRTIWNFRNFHLKFIQTEVVGALLLILVQCHTSIRKPMLVDANAVLDFCVCQIIWRKDWNFSSIYKCLSFRRAFIFVVACVRSPPAHPIDVYTLHIFKFCDRKHPVHKVPPFNIVTTAKLKYHQQWTMNWKERVKSIGQWTSETQTNANKTIYKICKACFLKISHCVRFALFLFCCRIFYWCHCRCHCQWGKM